MVPFSWISYQHRHVVRDVVRRLSILRRKSLLGLHVVLDHVGRMSNRLERAMLFETLCARETFRDVLYELGAGSRDSSFKTLTNSSTLDVFHREHEPSFGSGDSDILRDRAKSDGVNVNEFIPMNMVRCIYMAAKTCIPLWFKKTSITEIENLILEDTRVHEYIKNAIDTRQKLRGISKWMTKKMNDECKKTIKAWVDQYIDPIFAVKSLASTHADALRVIYRARKDIINGNDTYLSKTKCPTPSILPRNGNVHFAVTKLWWNKLGRSYGGVDNDITDILELMSKKKRRRFTRRIRSVCFLFFSFVLHIEIRVSFSNSRTLSTHTHTHTQGGDSISLGSSVLTDGTDLCFRIDTTKTKLIRTKLDTGKVSELKRRNDDLKIVKMENTHLKRSFEAYGKSYMKTFRRDLSKIDANVDVTNPRDVEEKCVFFFFDPGNSTFLSGHGIGFWSNVSRDGQNHVVDGNYVEDFHELRSWTQREFNNEAKKSHHRRFLSRRHRKYGENDVSLHSAMTSDDMLERHPSVSEAASAAYDASLRDRCESQVLRKRSFLQKQRNASALSRCVLDLFKKMEEIRDRIDQKRHIVIVCGDAKFISHGQTFKLQKAIVDHVKELNSHRATDGPGYVVLN